MADIQIYADEDACERAVINGLRKRGIDVLTTMAAGNAGKSDEEQLEFAAAQRRCIYTFNVRDFARLHGEFLSQGRDHAGIVMIPDQRYSVGEKIRRREVAVGEACRGVGQAIHDRTQRFK